MEDFFINHSCNASVWFHPTENKFLARRDIKMGEEVTYDYGTTECNPKWGMDCRCGLECCRGRISGDDWKNPEFRARFKGHFFGGVQKKIDEFEKEMAAKEEAKAAEDAAKAAQEAKDSEPLPKGGKRKTSASDKELTENQKGTKDKKQKQKKALKPKADSPKVRPMANTRAKLAVAH